MNIKRAMTLALAIMVSIVSTPITLVSAEENSVKISTAVSNIDRYDKVLTGLEAISESSTDFKDRNYELNLLTNFMLMSGYIHTYNESVKSNNAADVGSTNPETSSYDNIFKQHIDKIVTSLGNKDEYIKTTFADKEGAMYKGLFTNQSLNVYLKTIDDSKNEPIVHAKLLTEGLIVESDNRLRIILKEISDAGDEGGASVLKANKSLIVDTMDAYKTVYAATKTLYGLGIQTFDSSKLDTYNRAYVEIYNAYDAISKKYGISLNSTTLVSEDIVNVNASDLLDLVASVDTGNPKKLSTAYLSIFADSAVFMPFVTKVNTIQGTEYLNEDILQKLNRPFGNRRKPLYLMEVDDQVEDYVKNGGTPNKARVATLHDLIGDVENVDIALFLKRDSEASSITALGLEGNPELSEDQREKIEGYRLPGMSKDFTDAVYMAAATSVKSNGADKYMKANTNYFLLNNSVANYKESKEVAAEMLSSLYMDIYGNIVTEVGYVVVPAVTNAMYYNEAILPLNASLFLNYPVFGSGGSSIAGNRSEDNNKLILTVFKDKLSALGATSTDFYKSADGTIDYTDYGIQTMIDLSNNRESSFFKAGGTVAAGDSKDNPYIHPFTPYVWHKGITDPYRILDNPVDEIDVYASKFARWANWWTKTSFNKMKLVPILDKVIVSGEGAGYNLSNLLVSEQVQKAVYEQNFHYLTTDQTSEAPTGAPIGYSNGVLNDGILLDIAQEVARGADIGKIMVGDLGKTTLMQDVIKSRGMWGSITSTIAGFGEDIHRLFHSGAKNLVTYVPNISELPTVQNIVIGIVPITVTMVILIFFILIIVTFISKKGNVKELIIKVVCIMYVIFFLVALMPIIITSGFNSATNITSSNISYSLLVEQENEDKGVSTLAFDSFNSLDKLTTTSPDIIHAKLSQKDIETQLNAAGLPLTEKENSISSFLFSDDRKFISLDENNIIYIRGNNLVTPITSLYNSSKVTFKQVVVPHPTAMIDVVTYKLYQDWTNDPKPHYFMPYYMLLDNLIYNANTVAEQTYTIPLIKKYQSENKTTNLASTYFTSLLFTEPDIYNKLGIELINAGVTKGEENKVVDPAALKGIEAFQETAMLTKDALGDTYDFLGLFNILQLPGRSVTAPFTGSNIDMEAVKRTSWASNYYVEKLNNTVTTHLASNSKPVVIVNGYMTDDKNPALFTDTDIYVPLTFLDAIGFKHSISKDNKLAIWGNDIRFETVIGTADYKVATETATKKYAKTIKGSPVVVSEGRAMFPISMLEYYGGNVSAATNRKSATVILRDFKKTGMYGDIIDKVYKVNDNVRNFVSASKDYLVTVSDENMLKMLSLYASIEFADNFTNSSHELSPISLSSGRINYDTYLKSIFIPSKELTNTETVSLYYYIAYRYPSLILIFAVYQIVLLIFSLAKIFALYGVIVLFVVFALRYFIFRHKSDPVIFKAILIAITYIYISHAIIFIGFKTTSTSINTGNDNFLASFGAALLLNILALMVSIAILLFTLLAIKKNPSTLGYEGLTGWIGKVVSFMKSNNKLKNIVSKINPNLLSHKEKLSPNKKINLNQVKTGNKLDVEEEEDVASPAPKVKESYVETEIESSSAFDVTKDTEFKGGPLKLSGMGISSLGTAKVVSIDSYEKELKENPDIKDNKFLQVGDKIVDIDRVLKTKGEDKNIVRINAADTTKATNILKKDGITSETHGSSIVALTTDKELATVESKYNKILQNKDYSSKQLVKVKGDIQSSGAKQILKENGITDYTEFDKSLIMTKESAGKVTTALTKAGLKLENIEGLKAADKESFKSLQKNLGKKVILDNFVVYSPETKDLAVSTGKIFVKDVHSFETNPLCVKSAEEFLASNNIEHDVKGKLITLHGATLTQDLVNSLDTSVSINAHSVSIKNNYMTAKDILGIK